jgi:hypothetical protein
MIVEYINRYEDLITFKEISGNILMTINKEPDELFFRIGWDSEKEKENGVYSMIDPSGGPFITKNTDMGRFHKDWEGKIVKFILEKPSAKNTYLLVIKK